MPRKKIADLEPVTMDGPAAAPAKAPAKKRAPRASAKAVTHKHKKAEPLTVDAAPVPAPSVIPTSTTPTPEEIAVPSTPTAPSHEEIARLAYLLWEQRGYCGGSPDDDWICAERTLTGQSK